MIEHQEDACDSENVLPKPGRLFTHHDFAVDALRRMSVGKWMPVYTDGGLYVVDPETSLWKCTEDGDLMRVIAQNYDGRKHCSRHGDYTGISEIAQMLCTRDQFFAGAPIGLACPNGFYRVSGSQIVLEPLTPAHQQRVRLDFDPWPQPTPLFDDFLMETFRSTDLVEADQQRQLIQEIAGAIMLGLLHLHQKAILFYDPYGRAGKGTLESILRQLVPASFVTAVSPFNWNKEYYVMALAGSRLNVVGELPDDQAIPAAHFKSVIGKDLITGRNPAGRPVSFVNQAAHVFMSNHLISTREYSEAFFERWQIVEFPNSRLKLKLSIDPNVAKRIIESELPGVAHWAIQGGQRLLQQGKFSSSAAHDRLMAKWRRTSSSLEEFVHECCDLGEKLRVKRTLFYESYVKWCKASGRMAFSTTKLKELMVHNVKLGIRSVEVNGYEHFRGVQLREGEIRLEDCDF